jgi:hypothetical protein
MLPHGIQGSETDLIKWLLTEWYCNSSDVEKDSRLSFKVHDTTAQAEIVMNPQIGRDPVGLLLRG